MHVVQKRHLFAASTERVKLRFDCLPFALSIGSTKLCKASKAMSVSSGGALLLVNVSIVSFIRSISVGAECISLISCIY